MGTVRVGLAASDPDGLLAMPVATLERADAVAQVVAYVRAHQVSVIYVGLPRHLSGAEGPSAVAAREFAAQVDAALTDADQACQISFVDERFTTVAAEAQLRAAGRKGAKRRAVVDQVAAVGILQHALDSARLQSQS